MPAAKPQHQQPQRQDGNVIYAAARFIRLPVVQDRTGLSKPSIYRLMKAGTFPLPVQLMGDEDGSPIAWIESQVQEWIDLKATTAPIRGIRNGKRGPDGWPLWLREKRAKERA